MLSCTLFVVMFTVILMGGSTTWVLQKLGIIDHAPVFRNSGGASGSPPRKGASPTSQTPRKSHPNTRSYRALRQFDFKYLQPLLLAVPMKRLPREGPDQRRRRGGDDRERVVPRSGRTGFQGTGSGGGEFEGSERAPLNPGGVRGRGAGGRRRGRGGGGAGGARPPRITVRWDTPRGGFSDPAERSLWGSGEV